MKEQTEINIEQCKIKLKNILHNLLTEKKFCAKIIIVMFIQKYQKKGEI